jgi:predicted nucleic acid-binding protein
MIISDSSTLILLTKSGLIEKFLSNLTLTIPETVYDETVRKGIENGKLDAYLIEKIVRDDKIQVKQSNKDSLKKIQGFFNIHCGESDAIALCMDYNAEYLLCDDKKAINTCRVLGIRFVTAIDILLAMSIKGTISNYEANTALDHLDEFGWYNIELIRKIRGEIND